MTGRGKLRRAGRTDPPPAASHRVGPARWAAWTIAVLALAASALLGCGLEAPPAEAPPAEPAFAPHRGPILLVTLDALRADVVHERLTPHLAGFLAEADWGGTAVAPSSWTAPSMASLWTGLQPWRHGVIHPGRARLAEELDTLPEALAAAGYETVAYRSNHWLSGKLGYRQGVDVFRQAGTRGNRPARYLAGLGELDGTPRFVWVHLLMPHTPYRRHEQFLDRLDDPPADLPAQIRPLDLERWFDPSLDPPADELARIAALYRLNAAFADHVLGKLLGGLRHAGLWDASLVVVTSDHGEELGEHGQLAHGGNLGRELVEVPLAIKLPRGFGGAIAPPETTRPALARLFATLVEAAGGTPAADAAPSLFRPAAVPALSELYLGNGTNELSLVEGDRQLRWTACFLDPEPEYYRARIASLGGRPEPSPSEPPDAIFERLEAAFDRAPPLSGTACDPRWTVERWTGGSGAEAVDDPAAARQMARALRTAWRAANGEEIPPGRLDQAAQSGLDAEDVERVKALGYVP